MENKLTNEEEQFLKNFAKQLEDSEKAQVNELFILCNNPYQFAKTHSNYVKDWEKTKNQMVINLNNKKLPPDTSVELYGEIIKESDKVIKKKLELVRMLFENKFNESIYNYLGKDGKTKFLGLF